MELPVAASSLGRSAVQRAQALEQSMGPASGLYWCHHADKMDTYDGDLGKTRALQRLK